jgi:hypothetical protein
MSRNLPLSTVPVFGAFWAFRWPHRRFREVEPPVSISARAFRVDLGYIRVWAPVLGVTALLKSTDCVRAGRCASGRSIPATGSSARLYFLECLASNPSIARFASPG